MDAPAEKTSNSRVAAVLFAVGSVVVAAITAISLYLVLHGYQAQIKDARQNPDLQAVVAARVDLVPGKPIVEADLLLVKASVAGLPAGCTFGAPGEVVGKNPADRVLAGEVLRKEHLTEFAPKADLAALVRVGDRAIAIQTDHASGVAGLVVPGNFVDVMVTIRPDSSALDATWVTETILQAARVLAVGPAVLGAPTEGEAGGKEKPGLGPDNRPVEVTLEVTPGQAEKVALAASRGVLHLSLRNSADQDVAASRGPLITNALVGISARVKPSAAPPGRAGGQRASQAAPAPAPAPSAEVIEGTRTVIQTFDETGRKVLEPPKRR